MAEESMGEGISVASAVISVDANISLAQAKINSLQNAGSVSIPINIAPLTTQIESLGRQVAALTQAMSAGAPAGTPYSVSQPLTQARGMSPRGTRTSSRVVSAVAADPQYAAFASMLRKGIGGPGHARTVANIAAYGKQKGWDFPTTATKFYGSEAATMFPGMVMPMGDETQQPSAGFIAAMRARTVADDNERKERLAEHQRIKDSILGQYRIQSALTSSRLQSEAEKAQWMTEDSLAEQQRIKDSAVGQYRLSNALEASRSQSEAEKAQWMTEDSLAEQQRIKDSAVGQYSLQQELAAAESQGRANLNKQIFEDSFGKRGKFTEDEAKMVTGEGWKRDSALKRVAKGVFDTGNKIRRMAFGWHQYFMASIVGRGIGGAAELTSSLIENSRSQAALPAMGMTASIKNQIQQYQFQRQALQMIPIAGPVVQGIKDLYEASSGTGIEDKKRELQTIMEQDAITRRGIAQVDREVLSAVKGQLAADKLTGNYAAMMPDQLSQIQAQYQSQYDATRATYSKLMEGATDTDQINQINQQRIEALTMLQVLEQQQISAAQTAYRNQMKLANIGFGGSMFSLAATLAGQTGQIPRAMLNYKAQAAYASVNATLTQQENLQKRQSALPSWSAISVMSPVDQLNTLQKAGLPQGYNVFQSWITAKGKESAGSENLATKNQAVSSFEKAARNARGGFSTGIPGGLLGSSSWEKYLDSLIKTEVSPSAYKAVMNDSKLQSTLARLKPIGRAETIHYRLQFSDKNTPDKTAIQINNAITAMGRDARKGILAAQEGLVSQTKMARSNAHQWISEQHKNAASPTAPVRAVLNAIEKAKTVGEIMSVTSKYYKAGEPGSSPQLLKMLQGAGAAREAILGFDKTLKGKELGENILTLENQYKAVPVGASQSATRKKIMQQIKTEQEKQITELVKRTAGTYSGTEMTSYGQKMTSNQEVADAAARHRLAKSMVGKTSNNTPGTSDYMTRSIDKRLIETKDSMLSPLKRQVDLIKELLDVNKQMLAADKHLTTATKQKYDDKLRDMADIQIKHAMEASQLKKFLHPRQYAESLLQHTIGADLDMADNAKTKKKHDYWMRQANKLFGGQKHPFDTLIDLSRSSLKSDIAKHAGKGIIEGDKKSLAELKSMKTRSDMLKDSNHTYRASQVNLGVTALGALKYSGGHTPEKRMANDVGKILNVLQHGSGSVVLIH